MDKITLDIIKLRWHAQILQGLLVRSIAAFSASMGEPPQELRQSLLDALETTQRENYDLLLSSAPESECVLLAEEFAQLVEQMKTSIASLLVDT